MVTTVFGNLVTSIGAQLAGVPPAALAPLLWNAVLLVGVRRAIEARDRRRVELESGSARARAEEGEFRSAA